MPGAADRDSARGGGHEALDRCEKDELTGAVAAPPVPRAALVTGGGRRIGRAGMSAREAVRAKVRARAKGRSRQYRAHA